jgi:hypothetical protein
LIRKAKAVLVIEEKDRKEGQGGLLSVPHSATSNSNNTYPNHQSLFHSTLKYKINFSISSTLLFLPLYLMVTLLCAMHAFGIQSLA